MTRWFHEKSRKMKSLIDDSLVEESNNKSVENISKETLMFRATIANIVNPNLQKIAERLTIKLEETKRMDEEYTKISNSLGKIGDASKGWNYKKMFMYGVTGLAIGYYIYKVALYKEIPAMLSAGVDLITSALSDTIKKATPKDVPTVQPPTEWLNIPTVSPSELLIYGSVTGVFVLGFKVLKILRRLVK